MFKKLFDAIYVKTLYSIHNYARNILDIGKTLGKIKRNIYIEFYLKRFPWKIREAEWELGFLADVLGIVTLNNTPEK